MVGIRVLGLRNSDRKQKSWLLGCGPRIFGGADGIRECLVLMLLDILRGNVRASFHAADEASGVEITRETDETGNTFPCQGSPVLRRWLKYSPVDSP